MNRLALALSLSLCAGCASSDETPPPPPQAKPRPIVVDRAVLRALGDYVHAGYAARERLDGATPPDAAALSALEERLALARGQLAAALREAGAGQVADDQLVKLVLDGLARGGRYRVVQAADDSFSVVRVAEEDERVAVLFGEKTHYRRVVHDETLVLDLAAWRAREAGGAAAARPVTWAVDAQGRGTVLVDRAAILALGETQVLPQLDALRAGAREARDEGAFLSRAGEERLGELLGLTRAALRWRSLDPVLGLVASRSREEHLHAFADDYAARAELRAACELRELARLRPDDARPLDDKEGALLLELASLSAMVHGEPLGAAADALALATLSLPNAPGGRKDAPPFVAARRVTVGLARALRPGQAEGQPQAEGDARQDALAFHALARIEPDDLREVARQLHARRLAEPR